MPYERLWTVARFPSGEWCEGGSVNDPEYAESWVTQVMAKDRADARKKGKAKYYREQKKAKS